MSPSHHGENSLDDLGSTGSEPTTRAPLGLTTNLNNTEHYSIDFPRCFPPLNITATTTSGSHHAHQHHQQHHHHHHHPYHSHHLKSSTDMLDTPGGSNTILRDYHAL